MLRDSKIGDLPLEEAYQQHCSILGQARLKITMVLAMLLVGFFGVLDLVVYPEIVTELIAARVVIDIILAAILVALQKKQYKHSAFISIAAVSLIFILIDVLIFLTDGMSSTYYAGLNLALVAFSAMMPWKTYEALLSFIIMLCFYVLAVLFHADVRSLPYDIPSFLNNLFFIISVGIFCIVATYLNSKLRFREFSLNYNLDFNLKQETMRLRSTQAQLVQSEKINAIGSMTAGLLHEVNNPLNYTMMALHMIKISDAINADQDLKDVVKDVEEGMNRIKTIVTDLRAFAYPEEADKQNQFSIQGAVVKALRFTSDDCKDIARISNIDPTLMVIGSETHIVQLLINLLSNAARAISRTDKKGLITITAKTENNRVIVAVTDDGCGMSQEVLKRVFDPFFTTNEVGKGMGIGLSVSYTIAKNHGGNIMVTSEEGIGTTFSFDLAMGGS
jgi:two-component system, sensor histidine kinase PhcS